MLVPRRRSRGRTGSGEDPPRTRRGARRLPGRRERRGPAASGCSRWLLLSDQVPDSIAAFEERDRPARGDAARPRKLDRDLLTDPRRARAEHDDPIAKVNRLVDVVRDEEDRLSRALPDAGQLLLHGLPRLRVE